MTQQSQENRPTKKNTEQFEMIFPILNSVFNEIKELSKKKQDGALNEVKVKMTNRILQKTKEILKNDPTTEFLDLLDEEVFPTNSDAVLVIAQFKAAMEQYRSKYYTYSKSAHCHIWRTID